ncbi:hypothetical protein ACFL6C_13715, partial [Myxococcota bacterium]
GTGQFEVRVTPGLGYAGYRLNITSAQDDGVGIAIRPSLGTGYWSMSNRSGNDSDNVLVLAPNLAVMVGLADGKVYLAPRFGYLHMIAFDENDDDSTGILSFGANVGYIIESDPFQFSLELSFQRLTSTEERADGAVYMIAPTVGIQLQ